MLFTMEREVLVHANGEKTWEVLLYGARMVQGFATADPIAPGKTWSGQVCALPAGHVPQRLLVPAYGFTLLQISVRGFRLGVSSARDVTVVTTSQTMAPSPWLSENRGRPPEDRDKFRCAVWIGMPADGWRVRAIRVHGRMVSVTIRHEDGSATDALALDGELPIRGDSPLRAVTFHNDSRRDRTIRFTVTAERIMAAATEGQMIP